MLASIPASMLNQKRPDLGIPNRFKLSSSRFRRGKRKDSRSRLGHFGYNAWVNWLHTAGVEFMNKLVEIRNQEFMCRERALLDSERKVFWLAKAEEWEQCALDEIAFHFRECNLDITDSQKAAS
jgi:hypothetical protein